MNFNSEEKTDTNITAPMVSVVVPTYNRAALLNETVNCILSQTVADFELIIVDNMSNDGTEQYVNGIQDPRVRYFRNPNNGIIAVSRNLGIKNAGGKYVAFCDDDDLWLPDKLEKQLRYFSEENTSCVASDCIPIGEVKYLCKSLSLSAGQTFRDFSYKDILFSLNPVISSSVLARKDLLNDVGGFDESTDFCFIEDWELWLRLSRRGAIRILAEPLLKYRMYDKEGRDTRNVTCNMLRIIDKHESLGFMDETTGQTARANCSIVIGRAFLDFDDREGIKYYWRGLLACSTVSLRIKALLGLSLYLFPSYVRKLLFSLVHYMH